MENLEEKIKSLEARISFYELMVKDKAPLKDYYVSLYLSNHDEIAKNKTNHVSIQIENYKAQIKEIDQILSSLSISNFSDFDLPIELKEKSEEITKYLLDVNELKEQIRKTKQSLKDKTRNISNLTFDFYDKLSEIYHLSLTTSCESSPLDLINEMKEFLLPKVKECFVLDDKLNNMICELSSKEQSLNELKEAFNKDTTSFIDIAFASKKNALLNNRKLLLKEVETNTNLYNELASFLNDKKEEHVHKLLDYITHEEMLEKEKSIICKNAEEMISSFKDTLLKDETYQVLYTNKINELKKLKEMKQESSTLLDNITALENEIDSLDNIYKEASKNIDTLFDYSLNSSLVISENEMFTKSVSDYKALLLEQKDELTHLNKVTSELKEVANDYSIAMSDSLYTKHQNLKREKELVLNSLDYINNKIDIIVKDIDNIKLINMVNTKMQIEEELPELYEMLTKLNNTLSEKNMILTDLKKLFAPYEHIDERIEQIENELAKKNNN